MTRCEGVVRARWLAVMACIAAGCGGGTPRPPSPPDILWRTREEMVPAEPWPGGALRPHRELAILDLAQAANAGIDLSPAVANAARSRAWRHELIVNLQSDHGIYFKGHAWPLRGDRRPEGLERLAREVGKLVRALPRDERRSTLASFTLRLDGSAVWSDVRGIFETVSEAGGPSAGWRFAVDSSGTQPWQHDAAFDATRGNAPPAAAVSLAVGLAIHADGLPALEFGGRSLGFAPGALYSAETLPIANRNWAELRTALVAAKARGPTALDLEVGDDVPWAYVAQTFAVCLDAGVPDVSVARTDLHFALSTPSTRWLPPYGTRDPRDWPTWVALAIGVAAAFLLFGRGLVRPHRPARRRAAA